MCHRCRDSRHGASDRIRAHAANHRNRRDCATRRGAPRRIGHGRSRGHRRPPVGPRSAAAIPATFWQPPTTSKTVAVWERSPVLEDPAEDGLSVAEVSARQADVLAMPWERDVVIRTIGPRYRPPTATVGWSAARTRQYLGRTRRPWLPRCRRDGRSDWAGIQNSAADAQPMQPRLVKAHRGSTRALFGGCAGMSA